MAAFLDLDLDDGEVVFQRGSEFRSSEWKLVVQFWLPSDYLRYESEDKFRIALQKLLADWSWFDVIWEGDGNVVTLSDSLRNAINEVTETGRQFEALGGLGYPTEVVPESIEGFKRNLTSFQRRDVTALLRMPFGSNFSVPGAGKTMVALAVWQTRRHDIPNLRLLVVAPKSAFSSWLNEVRDLFIDPPQVQIFGEGPIELGTSIVICNYEQLQSLSKLRRLTNWASNAPTDLVFDEAHRIKSGPIGVRWRAAHNLRQVARRVDLLTGTPMPQDYEDLRSLFRLSWNNLPPRITSDAGIRALNRGGVFVRTTKDELGLPTPTLRFELIQMGPIQREVYDALRRQYAGSFRLSSSQEDFFAKRGKAAMTLIAAATNPGLIVKDVGEDPYLSLQWPPREVSTNASLLAVLHDYARNEIPPKYQWLIQHVARLAREGKKVLVWSTFVGNLLAMERVLKNFGPVVVHGSVSAADRAERIKRFEEDESCSVLITNPQTLGEGVSLHRVCHDAVFVDRSYNAGLYLQAVDRIHRLGLAHDVETNIVFLISEGSIDERVAIRVKEKVGKLFQAMGDPGLVVADMHDDDNHRGMHEGFSNEDLDDLLSHLVSE